jgi:protein-tyrosine kinase
MSRIYDALHKAKHKIAGDSLESGTPPQEKPDPALEAKPGSLIEANSARPPQAENEDSSKPGLLTAFAERCPQTEWAPDPSAILFYAEEFRTTGSEEFRTLRSRLELVREAQSLRTLLVTSPMPGEGKSFIAANLAQVMVWQRERHVLLVDGDLRASKLHQSLGVGAVPGLSDYLRGDVNEFAVVRRGPLENLFFIPGGTPVPDASELIANGRFRALLKRLSGAFDWIIVDSPPLIPVADARLMAEFCDGVLMVLETGQTPGDLAQLAYEGFRGKRFVGVVLNRADPQSTYGYDYYYPKKESTPKGKGNGNGNRLKKLLQPWSF